MNIELRDYFAGLAMQKLLKDDMKYAKELEELCDEAYEIADAMVFTRDME